MRDTVVVAGALARRPHQAKHTWQFLQYLLGFKKLGFDVLFLDRLEKYSASLSEADRQTPAVAQALDGIARDDAARARYLDFERDADQPAVRARMIELAQGLGGGKFSCLKSIEAKGNQHRSQEQRQDRRGEVGQRLGPARRDQRS